MKSIAPGIVFCVFLGMCAGMYAEPVKFVRYPHIFEDTIVFTYHGDIWAADADGGNPRRLTVHVARDVFPRFSPDGRWVAFPATAWATTTSG